MPHIHEKVDFTAEVFVVCEDKVLLRKHDKHNIWLGVGGHVELDEEPNATAVREVKEEVGLDVALVGEKPELPDYNEQYRELIPPRFMNIHNVSPTHEHIALTYFARASTLEVTDEGREQSRGLKWFTKKEIEAHEELSEIKKHYALCALKELGGGE